MSAIVYRDTLDGITPNRLRGFFVGWPFPPSPEHHLRLLQGSDYCVLALDGPGGRVVGFVTALTDGVLTAYLPLLEVLPDYQARGVGSELMRRMLQQLEPFPNVDLLCDPELQPFYARFGLQPVRGMVRRNRQALARLQPMHAKS